MIDVIGVPFDLCGSRPGCALGPAAVRYAGLVETLQGIGLEVRDCGDMPAMRPETDEDGMRNFPPLLETVRGLRKAVYKTYLEGNLPIVVGGEHTVVAGAVAAALQFHGEDVAVLWIDAHADANTPGSSASGNLHGMPIAALAGLPSGTEGKVDEEWNALQEALGSGPRLSLNRTAWYALRDVDPPEVPQLQGLALTMHDIDRHGVVNTMHTLDRWLRTIGASHLWISFDVDALDPILAPGTGTAVRGGLTYREAHLCAELLFEMMAASDCPYRLAGVDVVETNPLVDANNATAVMVVEWFASLFGKTILGSRR
ncbi:arginase [Fimbriimonas ginsengisoli]|uniref:Arginase n=1 Tax=Fimbriimonas ginsengisoli Gsoil 348 TaxID=661478 RepID=A0A068NQT0_FIMGI|nr:arginase [Fimbriimonas ginsengisoli]AIE85801.1 arginase [Fimbriimonas ginsengisoli Gsoil 348]